MYLTLRIGKYRLDGWIEAKGLGIEFHVMIVFSFNVQP